MRGGVKNTSTHYAYTTLDGTMYTIVQIPLYTRARTQGIKITYVQCITLQRTEQAQARAKDLRARQYSLLC